MRKERNFQKERNDVGVKAHTKVLSRFSNYFSSSFSKKKNPIDVPSEQNQHPAEPWNFSTNNIIIFKKVNAYKGHSVPISMRFGKEQLAIP